MKVGTCTQCGESRDESYECVRDYKTSKPRFQYVCEDCTDWRNYSCSRCRRTELNPWELVLCDRCGSTGQTCMRCLGIDSVPLDAWFCSRACGASDAAEAAEAAEAGEKRNFIEPDNEEVGLSDDMRLNFPAIASPPKKRAPNTVSAEEKAAFLDNLYAEFKAHRELRQLRFEDVEAKFEAAESKAFAVACNLASIRDELKKKTCTLDTMSSEEFAAIGELMKKRDQHVAALSLLDKETAALKPQWLRHKELAQLVRVDLAELPTELFVCRALEDYAELLGEEFDVQ